MTDQTIIQELKKGNSIVFENLYRHFPIIRTHILKNNGSEEDAKDIFQNALIVFYKKAISPQFELTSKISTYLFSVSKNLWLDVLKSKKTTLNNIPEISSEYQEDEPSLPIENYIANKINELGEPCISILVMHSYNNLSMAEITHKLGYANEHTTRQQKYKCLQRLKKLIPYQEIQAYLN